MKQTATPAGATEVATRRIVLLGASNLTKSIGTVLSAAGGIWGEPLDVLTALGHGRSYGRVSRVLGVQLPGIESCGLWNDLADRRELPTAALVTDIGNDLLYEQPVRRIATWVEQCLDRLAAVEAHSIVTALPLANLERLSAARFRLFRTLFFPWSRITLAEVKDRAAALDAEVRRLARERQFITIEHRPAWYGFDPVHIRYSLRPVAWSEILRNWSAEQSDNERAARALWRTVYLRTRAPERRRVWGIDRSGRKPAARFADGTSIAIY